MGTRYQITLILLVSITIITSSVSLAMNNKSNIISFAWYSRLKKQFIALERDIKGDEWLIDNSQKEVRTYLITQSNSNILKKHLDDIELDFKNNVYLLLTMENVDLVSYRMKVSKMVQVGKRIHVQVSLSSPAEFNENHVSDTLYDFIMINKSQIFYNDITAFYFEDQYGNNLSVLNSEYG